MDFCWISLPSHNLYWKFDSFNSSIVSLVVTACDPTCNPFHFEKSWSDDKSGSNDMSKPIGSSKPVSRPEFADIST